MPYRAIYAGLAFLAVAVIALGVAFAPQGRPVELPGPVEAVFPRPGDAVLQQTVLEVDLATGYRAQIWVDGFLVPDSEVVYVDATGVHRWQPGPASLYMTEWRPGEHTVTIRWNTTSGPPDVGEFTWSFRIQ
ncbi:MAG: hypothetical protein KatS3mg011_2189 [Acidimicrobiia bacterium]|nr:MAG: hypothetical protein KatS3mg011_2189 [Acidimicrobiia bacterium]